MSGRDRFSHLPEAHEVPFVTAPGQPFDLHEMRAAGMVERKCVERDTLTWTVSRRKWSGSVSRVRPQVLAKRIVVEPKFGSTLRDSVASSVCFRMMGFTRGQDSFRCAVTCGRLGAGCP